MCPDVVAVGLAGSWSHGDARERWGPLTERRFVLPSRLEVEMGVASPWWAATDPVDPGARKVVEDGISIVYDPGGVLARLLDAYR